MTAAVTNFPGLHAKDLMANARALRDEARDASMVLAEQIISEAGTLADRCAEASRIDSMPAGIRDAILKLGIELQSRIGSANAIISGVK